MAMVTTAARIQLGGPLFHAVKPCEKVRSRVSQLNVIPKPFCEFTPVRHNRKEARCSLKTALWGTNLPKQAAHSRHNVWGCSMSVGTETAVSDDVFADYKVSTAFLFPGQVSQ
jgi:hypothetical protein